MERYAANERAMSEPPSPLEKKQYLGFGERLQHRIPWWVRDDAIYHLRVRCAKGTRPLTIPETARALLESARFYHARRRWCVHLFLLMPDHWHALMSFPTDVVMSQVIGDWKRYHSRNQGMDWEDGYFDHRLRDHLEQYDATYAYIRRNPVVKGFCKNEDDWLWWWRADDIEVDTRPEQRFR
jgi:REP element-mobilizing transposase RayT